MKVIPLGLVLACLAVPAMAQIQPSEETDAFVGALSELLFDMLDADDFQRERMLMSDELAALVTPEDWAETRRQFVEVAGPTPRYIAHLLTYYPQETLYAAVDFSAIASKPDTYICGYVIWKFSSPNTLGFTRLEQNVVPGEIFRDMPLQDAAQTMTDWHCPPALIETVLGLKAE